MAEVIFLVDDDDGSREAMTRTLERVGYTMCSFPSAEEALERLRAGDAVDVIVSDVRMPGMDGYEFLREVRAEFPHLPFLLVTAFAEVEEAVAALQEGADDYLTKPVKMQELRQRVQLHLERRVLSDENRRLRQRLEKSFGFEGIVGHSRAMEELLDRLVVELLGYQAVEIAQPLGDRGETGEEGLRRLISGLRQVAYFSGVLIEQEDQVVCLVDAEDLLASLPHHAHRQQTLGSRPVAVVASPVDRSLVRLVTK